MKHYLLTIVVSLAALLAVVVHAADETELNETDLKAAKPGKVTLLCYQSARVETGVSAFLGIINRTGNPIWVHKRLGFYRLSYSRPQQVFGGRAGGGVVDSSANQWIKVLPETKYCHRKTFTVEKKYTSVAVEILYTEKLEVIQNPLPKPEKETEKVTILNEQ